MFFMPIRSGMTRCSICPSVSRVFNSSPRALKQGSSAFGEVDTLAKLESVIVGNHDLGAVYVV